jgi:hypothetical protein
VTDSRRAGPYHCSDQNQQLSRLGRCREAHPSRTAYLLLGNNKRKLAMLKNCVGLLFTDSDRGRRALPIECLILRSGYLIEGAEELTYCVWEHREMGLGQAGLYDVGKKRSQDRHAVKLAKMAISFFWLHKIQSS